MAVPPCADQPEARTLVSDLGLLESVTVGPDERLYFSEADAGQLMVLGRPGAEPSVLVDGVEEPGGLVFQRDGTLLFGYGTNISNGVVGNVAPQAGVLRVDVRTGETKPYASGLGQSNGLALGHDGTLYASNDFGAAGIDRVVNGEVEHGWARVYSPNGLVVDSAGRYLYAAQTFQPAAIARIEIANPSNVTTFFAATQEDWAAGLDGMTRDRMDRLYVTANGGGAIWRVNRAGEACSLANYPPFPDGPSAISFGTSNRRGPFPHTNLYFVSFAGELVELRKVFGAGARGAPGGNRSGGRRGGSKLPRRAAGRTIRGSRGDDRLVGTPRADRLYGMGGNDTLIGRRGADLLHGGRAEDRLGGGRGNDTIRARDGSVDLVRCGRGRRDVAVLDEVEDGVYGCEKVRELVPQTG